MKITVRVQVDAAEPGAVPAEDEATEQFREVFILERNQLTEASVELSLAEAHALLASIQEAVVCAQVTAALAVQRCCARCGRAQRHKDTRTITVRTLFRDAAPRQPTLPGLPVSSRCPRGTGHLQPARRDPGRAQYPGADVPAGPVRRGDVVRPRRAPAR